MKTKPFILYMTLVIGIILLFVGIGMHSAFAIDTK
jgi:hypothetical protein